jgi:hypothetical protein
MSMLDDFLDSDRVEPRLRDFNSQSAVGHSDESMSQTDDSDEEKKSSQED